MDKADWAAWMVSCVVLRTSFRFMRNRMQGGRQFYKSVWRYRMCMEIVDWKQSRQRHREYTTSFIERTLLAWYFKSSKYNMIWLTWVILVLRKGLAFFLVFIGRGQVGVTGKSDCFQPHEKLTTFEVPNVTVKHRIPNGCTIGTMLEHAMLTLLSSIQQIQILEPGRDHFH